MSQIELCEVSYRYPGESVPALRNVSLSVEPGEFVVVAGASGSGKSTLLNVVNGLAPHFHGGDFSGEATIAGMSTRNHGVGALAGAVGSLFQDPETQIVMGTPRGELAFPLENRGMTAAAIARAVEETALALAIEPLLDRPTAELSGGELQRVALGATLVSNPRIVCLDEPTSQLDPVAGDELISLLRRLNDDRDLTILLAEHRLERCLPFADRVIVIDGGQIVFDGTPIDFQGWALRTMPVLATPGARLLHLAGLEPAVSVKQARARLRQISPDFEVIIREPQMEALGRVAAPASERAPSRIPAGSVPPSTPVPSSAPVAPSPRRRRRRHRGLVSRATATDCALELSGVWHEIHDGPAILRGVSLRIGAGERVALMGRNGAGKSTLLAHAAGLMAPTRGQVAVAGRVALVLQNPNSYLIHDTVAEEASPAALERFGLTRFARRHPRDLSGGERQRLALAIVLGDGEGADAPAVVCMDEPTRGMDRGAKADIAELLKGMDGAVLVATHDPEFAATFAERVVLLASGAVIADGPVSEVLCGGSYFTTETARILGGAGGALVPEQGAVLLRRLRGEAVTV